MQTLPTISPTSLSSHLKAVAARNKAGPLHRGPVLQPGGEQDSSSDAHPALDPASTSANPLSLPDTDQPAEEPPVRRRGPKKYVCHHCGVVKPRKPDLTGHLWKVHQEGEPIICERPPCTGQSFSTRAALKKHVEGQHKKKWPYKCKDCHYGTRAKAYYVEHRISQHGAWMVNSKTKEPLDYSCKKMQENLQGPSFPSEAYPEGQMYAAEEISVPTVPKIVQGECKERHPHPDLPSIVREEQRPELVELVPKF